MNRNFSQDLLHPSHPLVLFDGICNLCNSSVQFIIKRDPNKKFRFAPLQSPIGQRILQEVGLPSDELQSVILVDGGKCYLKSSAFLQIFKRLGGGWAWLYSFILIPRVIRDLAYNFIARHRYRWFGKKEACMIPTADIKARFLEDLD